MNSLSDREEETNNKEKLEEGPADSEASAHQPSHAAVMQPSASERSLRRTARVKTGKLIRPIYRSPNLFKSTAKNNSEFIYYGKYNKELPRPRSFSKNNQQLAAGDSSDSSNGGKSLANVSKGACSKGIGNAGNSASAAQKGKRPPAKNQPRGALADGSIPSEGLLVRTQRSEKGPKGGNKETELADSAARIGNKTVVSNFLTKSREEPVEGTKEQGCGEYEENREAVDWQDDAAAKAAAQGKQRCEALTNASNQLHNQ